MLDADFEALYRGMYGELLDFAFRYVRSRDLAHDVVQEVFASLWRRGKDWKPQGNVATYLYAAVRLRAIDVRTRNNHLHAITDDSLSSPSEPVDIALENADTKTVLSRAIDNLPERQRDAVLLCYGRGMSVAEAARVLEISHTAATNLLTRALERLKGVVKEF